MSSLSLLQPIYTIIQYTPAANDGQAKTAFIEGILHTFYSV
jgi:hypothetical protein